MNKEIVARAISRGNCRALDSCLDEQTQWIFYGIKVRLKGRADILGYCMGKSDFFQSVTKYTEEFGVVTQGNNIAIHGIYRFVREVEHIRSFNFCHWLEFDGNEHLLVIRTYLCQA